MIAVTRADRAHLCPLNSDFRRNPGVRLRAPVVKSNKDQVELSALDELYVAAQTYL
jgi:hypothetical protein